MERLKPVPPSCITPEAKTIAPLPPTPQVSSGDGVPPLHENLAKSKRKVPLRLLRSSGAQDELALKQSSKAFSLTESRMKMAGSPALGLRVRRSISPPTEESPSEPSKIKKSGASSSVDQSFDVEGTDSDLSASDEESATCNSMGRLSFGSEPRSTGSWHTDPSIAERSTLDSYGFDHSQPSSEEYDMMRVLRIQKFDST